MRGHSSLRPVCKKLPRPNDRENATNQANSDRQQFTHERIDLTRWKPAVSATTNASASTVYRPSSTIADTRSATANASS